MTRRSRKPGAALPAEAPRRTVRWAAAVYARLSVKNNGLRDDESSLEAQVGIVREWVSERDDMELHDVYVDNGRSGTTFEHRDGFERLMEDIRSGTVNCVVVKDLSRFGRNMLETERYLQDIFPFMGVRFVAINDGFDTLGEDPVYLIT